MKKKIKVTDRRGKRVEREVNYIPGRYIFALFLTILETVSVLAIMIICNIYIPYFWIASLITQVCVVISIICSNDNPDYKVPWLLFVMLLPVIGFMLYFLFYKRKLSKKFIKRINAINDSLECNDKDILKKLKEIDSLAYSEAVHLNNISRTHIYNDTSIKYFNIGEEWHKALLEDLRCAKEFILFEFFIVEEGYFWDSILHILKEKVNEGVEVNVMWDDIGCMSTLSGSYYKKLKKKYGINAIPFSRLKGQADNEFNNRNHRKILVIDGKVAYTGGINIADEYINKVKRFGHWKDMGIRLEGSSVNELTKLFFIDFYSNIKKEAPNLSKYYKDYRVESNSYVIPFGDGPKPIYEENVGKVVIMNILNHAENYVYITTPYLIIDSEMFNAIKNTALRGVDIRIIVPHIPDKKMVFEMTRSTYEALINSGVKIYEYEIGFVHGKLYLSDDKVAMIGTINLDYRSLTHHFENGVWIYNDECILDMKKDYMETLDKCIYMNDNPIKVGIFKRLIRKIAKIFSPLL